MHPLSHTLVPGASLCAFGRRLKKSPSRRAAASRPGRQPQLTLTNRHVEWRALPRWSSTPFDHILEVCVVALPRPSFLGRFASETAAARCLGLGVRAQNSPGLPSTYSPSDPQSLVAVRVGFPTRLDSTRPRGRIFSPGQGTDRKGQCFVDRSAGQY